MHEGVIVFGVFPGYEKHARQFCEQIGLTDVRTWDEFLTGEMGQQLHPIEVDDDSTQKVFSRIAEWVKCNLGYYDRLALLVPITTSGRGTGDHLVLPTFAREKYPIPSALAFQADDVWMQTYLDLKNPSKCKFTHSRSKDATGIDQVELCVTLNNPK